MSSAVINGYIGLVVSPLKDTEAQPAINPIASIARSLFAIYETFKDVSEMTAKRFQATQLTSLFSAPLDVLQFCAGVKDLATNEDRNQFYDNALSTFGDLTQAGDGIATASSGLVDLGLLSSHAMNWINPLSFISGLTSSVYLIIHLRGIQKANELIQIIDDQRADPVQGLKKKKFLSGKAHGHLHR